MYKKILMPLDGSKRAERILPHVRELAEKFGSELILAQVIVPQYRMANIENPSYFQVLLEELDQIESEATAYLGRIQKELQTEGMKVSTRIVRGTVVHSLLEIAEAEQVDLIALGSHGRTGLSRVYYGSVASGILNRTDRPLLLIRADGD